MSRINETVGVNNNVRIELNNIKNDSKVSLNSAFGDGFAADSSTALISKDSRFSGLMAQFNFEVPSYPKGGFAQFCPTDAEYQTMRGLDRVLDGPERVYSEV